MSSIEYMCSVFNLWYWYSLYSFDVEGGETGLDGLDGPVNSGSTHPNDRLLQKACLER